MLGFGRHLHRQGAADLYKRLNMLRQMHSSSVGVFTKSPSTAPGIFALHQQQHRTASRFGHADSLSLVQHGLPAGDQHITRYISVKRVRHIANSVAAPAPTIKHKWDSETAKQALASLAQEPQEFAKGVEVLDSIVKVYTVYSR